MEKTPQKMWICCLFLLTTLFDSGQQSEGGSQWLDSHSHLWCWWGYVISCLMSQANMAVSDFSAECHKEWTDKFDSNAWASLSARFSGCAGQGWAFHYFEKNYPTGLSRASPGHSDKGLQHLKVRSSLPGLGMHVVNQLVFRSRAIRILSHIPGEDLSLSSQLQFQRPPSFFKGLNDYGQGHSPVRHKVKGL